MSVFSLIASLLKFTVCVYLFYKNEYTFALVVFIFGLYSLSHYIIQSIKEE